MYPRLWRGRPVSYTHLDVYKRQGEIWLNGIKEKIRNPLDAIKKGLSIIFQEFNLIDALSITENIFIDRLSKSKGMWIDWKEANRKAAEFMKEVGYDIDTTTLIKDLSVAEKQMVEIAKAISYGSKIIIMDEPSATLTSRAVSYTHLCGRRAFIGGV